MPKQSTKDWTYSCVSYLSMTVHDSFSLSTHLMWNIVQSIHICVHEHEGTVRGQSAPFTQNVCNKLKIELHHSHLSHCFTDNSKESGPILLLCVHGSRSLWITNWKLACGMWCVLCNVCLISHPHNGINTLCMYNKMREAVCHCISASVQWNLLMVPCAIIYVYSLSLQQIVLHPPCLGLC